MSRPKPSSRCAGSREARADKEGEGEEEEEDEDEAEEEKAGDGTVNVTPSMSPMSVLRLAVGVV